MSLNPPTVKGEAIGVLGVMAPERSSFDRKMQQEFGTGVMEAYNGSRIGVADPDYRQRSPMDIAMQKEFNPYYKPGMFIMREGYINGTACGGVGNGGSTNTADCGGCGSFASITDDPYNPQSLKARYVPMK